MRNGGITPVLASALGGVFILASVASSSPLAYSPSPAIQVAPTGWGDAETRDIEVLLTNSASHILRYFPQGHLPPIFVEPGSRPFVLYRRGLAGEVVVRLNTGDRYWAQFAFQFGHELGHVLSRFDEDPTGNRWFEEALCEVAALTILRGMGESWQTDPPYPNWAGYAVELTRYAEQRIQESRQENSFLLADWYSDHAEYLAAHAEDRNLNAVVAASLLPLFEAAPEHWPAIQYLNDGRPAGPQTFEDYMKDWHRHAPPRHRRFIREIARQFGLEIRTAQSGRHQEERSDSIGVAPHRAVLDSAVS